MVEQVNRNSMFKLIKPYCHCKSVLLLKIHKKNIDMLIGSEYFWTGFIYTYNTCTCTPRHYI